jgi:hypothetical protein
MIFPKLMPGKIISIILILFLTATAAMSASEFDELEKPPEGAHSGQMLLGAFVSMGQPYGKFIDAEDTFLEGSVYPFDSDTSKAIQVSHLSFSMGLTFEYMPVDYIGAAARLRKSYIVQQSNFGPDYENWKGYLYRDTSILIGPTFHATTRKRWDFILTPLIGYNFAEYNAAPVAKLIAPVKKNDSKRTSMGLTYGGELNCTLYFSGGLFISIGGEWINNSLKFSEPVNLTKTEPDAKYDKSTSGNITSWGVVLAAGYAFSN